MQRSSYAPTANVASFLILLIATYLLFALFGNTQMGAFLYGKLVLDPSAVVRHFEVWRLMTYAFLHDLSSPFHLIFNALLFFMIGPQLEDRWGEKRFLVFVLLAIFAGGLFVVFAYLMGLTHAYVIGFSSVTVALIIAWGLTFSTSTIYLMMMIPVSGLQLVYFTVALEVIYAVSSSAISSSAHFGGMTIGFMLTLGLYKPKKISTLWRKLTQKNSRR